MTEWRKNQERVHRTHDEARASYNRLSRWYDQVAAGSEHPSILDGLILLNVQAGETVLEVGYGTGFGLERLAEAVGKSGKVHGIDLSDGMHHVANERIARAGLLDRVDLKVGDALPLPYADNMFDALFSTFVLDLMDTPEIPEMLAECFRVLHPGGRLVMASVSGEDGTGLMNTLYIWAHRTLPSLIDCRPIFLQKEIEAAGFRTRKRRIGSMWTLPVEIVLAVKPD